MKYKFLLISKEDAINPVNLGAKFVYDHKSEWLDESADEWCKYLTAGYVKGVDFVMKNNKAYMLLKSYLDLDADTVIFLCQESKYGADQME